jgi:hypothetical protein
MNATEMDATPTCDLRRLIAAGLPRGSAPRQIALWIEEQGWKVVKISRVQCFTRADKYVVRFDTQGDREYEVSSKVCHALPCVLRKRVWAEVEAPRRIYDNTMFTHVYIRAD